MLIDVGVCIVHQIHTSMDVSKITYAQAIAWIQLGLQIITASITDISQLQQIRGRQKSLTKSRGTNNDYWIRFARKKFEK